MTTAIRPLNRQEAMFYFWLAALLWLGMALVGVLIWSVSSASISPLVRVGAVADFPPRARPYSLPIEIKGQPSVGVYLVNTGAEILALNAKNINTLASYPCEERIVWVPVNGRFEGPCTGDKFALDGKWISVRGEVKRGLQSFPVEIREGEIWVDVSQAILGNETPSAIFTPWP